MRTHRRRFLKTAAAGTAAVLGAPLVLTAQKTDTKLIVGEGEHKYEVNHEWPQLPDKFTWQTTHNVAVDKAGNLYVIHEGRADQPDHPSIFVFDPEGKYIRSFGQQFQGGGHGIEIRQEGNQEFLYVCAYQMKKTFAKMDLKGETVWQKYAPMESGAYAPDEDKKPTGAWGRDRFMPTNFAFLDDGGFLLADGYGAFRIHRYDKDARWISSFGGAGAGEEISTRRTACGSIAALAASRRSSSATARTTRCSILPWTANIRRPQGLWPAGQCRNPRRLAADS